MKSVFLKVAIVFLKAVYINSGCITNTYYGKRDETVSFKSRKARKVFVGNTETQLMGDLR